MEGNFSAGGMIPGGSSYGALDLQGSMPVNLLQHPNHPHQGSIIQPPIGDVFSLSMGQIQLNPMADFNNEEDEPSSFNEEALNAQIVPGKGKNLTLWHRVKWTGSMVKLLITAVSYIDEDVASENRVSLGRRKCVSLQKKGKWRTVSKVMAERGLCVSPQQCEDKFNDLNKRYKKLNDILGRGTSCQVVENPLLLDMMDHLPDKAKDEVRKILSSKHLFYEEMCSYHNLNRLHLPPDPALQRSLQLALRSRDDLYEDDDHDGETGVHGDMNVAMQEKWMKSRLIELERQKMEVEMEMIELEKQRFKWQRFSRKKDQELEKVKMENEMMRLENEQMAMELNRMKMQNEASI